jgi:hypothetical protein
MVRMVWVGVELVMTFVWTVKVHKAVFINWIGTVVSFATAAMPIFVEGIVTMSSFATTRKMV